MAKNRLTEQHETTSAAHRVRIAVSNHPILSWVVLAFLALGALDPVLNVFGKVLGLVISHSQSSDDSESRNDSRVDSKALPPPALPASKDQASPAFPTETNETSEATESNDVESTEGISKQLPHVSVSSPPPASYPAVSVVSAETSRNTFELINRISPDDTRPAVLISAENGNSAYLTQRISARIGGLAFLFRPAFVSTGLFARAMAGDVSVLTELEIPKSIPFVLLANRVASTQPQEVFSERLIRAELDISVRIYKPSAKTWSSTFSVHALSTGFTETEAERNADDQAAERIRELLETR